MAYRYVPLWAYLHTTKKDGHVKCIGPRPQFKCSQKPKPPWTAKSDEEIARVNATDLLGWWPRLSRTLETSSWRCTRCRCSPSWWRTQSCLPRRQRNCLDCPWRKSCRWISCSFCKFVYTCVLYTENTFTRALYALKMRLHVRLIHWNIIVQVAFCVLTDVLCRCVSSGVSSVRSTRWN